MAIRWLLIMSIIPTVLASTTHERALQLNEEMEYLMSVANKPRIWGEGSLPNRSERSGPAPTQMEGIENLENRFFQDEVKFQAAQALEPAVDEESSEDEAADYRVDGTVPQAQ